MEMKKFVHDEDFIFGNIDANPLYKLIINLLSKACED